MSESDLDAVARAVFVGNRYMTLGTADADGQPWVSPVWFAREDYARPALRLRRARRHAARGDRRVVGTAPTEPCNRRRPL
jgi:predicted pyridoxine 5'-phosphate oxidase superfamily flavin-nucleotide-binding protein